MLGTEERKTERKTFPGEEVPSLRTPGVDKVQGYDSGVTMTEKI